jgi:hypothetical protein
MGYKKMGWLAAFHIVKTRVNVKKTEEREMHLDDQSIWLFAQFFSFRLERMSCADNERKHAHGSMMEHPCFLTNVAVQVSNKRQDVLECR